MPFAFSSNSGLESEVIFAGYGFNINNDSLKWNDYQGIDVKGKWVMILRADPETDKTESPSSFPTAVTGIKLCWQKIWELQVCCLVSGPASDPQDTFESLSSGDFSVGIPVFRIKREVADIILSKYRQEQFQNLRKN